MISRRRIAVAIAGLAATAGLVVAGESVKDQWLIGHDKSVVTCLPYRVYLIRRGHPTPQRGDLVAFKTKGLEPLFADGSLFTKLVIGLPGDEVVVTPRGVRVAGKFLPFRTQALIKLRVDPATLNRTYRLEAGQYFMAGTNPRAFDSRYYGPVSETQFAGTSRPLW